MESKKPSPRSLVNGVVLIAAILLSTMLYLVYSGNRMAARHTPLMDAAMEIKLEATLAHLWFEEILSGDRHEDIQQVWRHLDQADWYAQAMLDGGTNEEGKFLPLVDENMRSTIASVRQTLKKFRAIATLRHQNTHESLPGSDIDQEFDRVFEHFMTAADRIETLIQQNIRQELQRFRRISLILLVISAIASILVSFFLYRLERQREQHIGAIEKAHAEIQDQYNELNYLAHYDQLTDLPNRRLFLDRLEQALAHAQRKQSLIVLAVVDLDQFKSVNDQFGHEKGDLLLSYTAERLHKSVRAEDTVARLGGDEFTLILSDIDTREQALVSANAVAGKVLHELAQPFRMNGNSAYISASIGIAVFPHDGQSAEELLRNADGAMLEAKRNGKNNHQFHSAELNRRAARRLQIERDLRVALKEKQLTLYFQPQWDIQNGRLYGIETLVRWMHPEKGLLLPGEFIPIAESCGLIEQIDTWVLETACRQYQHWCREGLKPGMLAVNLSPIQFRRPDLVRTISGIVAEQHIDVGKLELELTESALMEDTGRTCEVIKQLSNLGIRFAIDDFGTGYSSMAYLRDFPAHTLKIDRSFINVIHQDKAADAILQNMIELAKNLDMDVIAEGIETEPQEAFVRTLGCRYAQGYRFAKPMPAKQYRELMISESANNVTIMPSRNDEIAT